MQADSLLAEPSGKLMYQFEERANTDKKMAQARPVRNKVFESSRGQGLVVMYDYNNKSKSKKQF